MGIYKKDCLQFRFIQDSFIVLLSLFSIDKMTYIMDVYKSLNISIGTVMKNPEMLKLIPDHVKTKD